MINPAPSSSPFPCSSCTALCCGPVQLNRPMLDKIVSHLMTLPLEERQRLSKQSRTELDCRFLDMETHSCSIYPVRPKVCQWYGSVPSRDGSPAMICPKLGHVVNPYPQILIDIEMLDFIKHEYVARSNEFDWRQVL